MIAHDRSWLIQGVSCTACVRKHCIHLHAWLHVPVTLSSDASYPHTNEDGVVLVKGTCSHLQGEGPMGFAAGSWVRFGKPAH